MVYVANVLADLIGLRRLRVSFLRVLRLRYRPLGILFATAIAMAVSLEMNAHLITFATRWDGMSEVDAAATGSTLRRRSCARPTAARRWRRTRERRWERSPHFTGPVAGTPALAPDRVLVGAYDPWQTLQTLPIAVDHWYVSQTWPWLTSGALRQSAHRDVVLLSFGPNPRPLQVGSVLQEVVDGRRDPQLRRLARVVARADHPAILLRWAANMDLAGLEPWGGDDPALYRAAYRHVVQLFRAEGGTNVRWVWSPSGRPGLAAYHPGEDVVDSSG